ncbi:MAG TPA: DUF4410 domain-containing protein [Myxococcota bacterium]|nr:DUF4410 domain-containing protein [Myxococcota bacterium]
MSCARLRAPALAAALLASLGTACTWPPQTVSETLPIRASAKIQVGEVTDAAGTSRGIDAAALLRDALEKSLGEAGILAPAGAEGEDYRLDLEIVDYEPGNAFKRWLLPGYGATLLRVHGKLVDLHTRAVTARVDHQARVLAGGAFTIGAWKSIFDAVAGDIAGDLAARSKGEGFTVNLEPWASHQVEIPLAAAPREFSIAPLTDARAERGRIGERTAAFGVSMGNVRFSRDVAAFLQEAVADDLRAAGHRVTEGGPGTEIRGQVLKFWVHTDTTPLYWDVIAEIELQLSLWNPGDVAPLAGSAHACTHTERTWVWPSLSLVEKVLDACLEELMAKVRSDAMWRMETKNTPRERSGGSVSKAIGRVKEEGLRIVEVAALVDREEGDIANIQAAVPGVPVSAVFGKAELERMREAERGR